MAISADLESVPLHIVARRAEIDLPAAQRAVSDLLTALGRDEIEVEVDRYVAIPGQALGYKVGQLEIQRLRADAERRPGPAFDIRAFHDTVLGSGSVGLTVLRQLVGAEPAPD